MKMSKKIRAIASAALISAMVMSMNGMTALADNTPVSGSSIQVNVDKYLVMDQYANVPDVTFSYTIEGLDKTMPANGNKPEIKASVNNSDAVTGMPTIGSTTFSPDRTYTFGIVPEGPVTEAYLTGGKRFVKEQAVVSFSAVSFKEPGIYRYFITENNINDDNKGLTKDPRTLVFDVYVTDQDGDGKLEINDYILHNQVDPEMDKTGGNYGNDKVTGFVNTYETKNLTFEKQVAGNQGDRSKKFQFTVEISNADPNTKYTLIASPSSALPANKNELKVGANKTVSESYSLSHYESITIQGLAKDTNYKITENDYTNEGYSTTNTKVANSLTTDDQTFGEVDEKVVFTNTKSVTTPTGIIMSFAPYILVLALAGVFAVMFLRKKREDF